MECAERTVELGPLFSSTGDAVVDVEVVTPDAGSKNVGLLPVGGLLACGYARVADQLWHCAPRVCHN